MDSGGAAIAHCDGPVVLVGHSYGGVVVTEAGTDEKVAALVYNPGFVPDTCQGQVVGGEVLRLKLVLSSFLDTVDAGQVLKGRKGGCILGVVLLLHVNDVCCAHR